MFTDDEIHEMVTKEIKSSFVNHFIFQQDFTEIRAKALLYQNNKSLLEESFNEYYKKIVDEVFNSKGWKRILVDLSKKSVYDINFNEIEFDEVIGHTGDSFPFFKILTDSSEIKVIAIESGPLIYESALEFKKGKALPIPLSQFTFIAERILLIKVLRNIFYPKLLKKNKNENIDDLFRGDLDLKQKVFEVLRISQYINE